jgi:DNA-binding XRE family transcriptional regulator
VIAALSVSERGLTTWLKTQIIWVMSQVEIDQLPANERLRLVREVLGLTQQQLADRVMAEAQYRTSAMTISRIEAGHRRPNLALAVALQKVANIPSDLWLRREGGVAA